MKTIVALLFVILAVALAAELRAADSPAAIHGSYIIVMNDNITSVDRDAHVAGLMAAAGATGDHSSILYKYDIGKFIAFAAKLSDKMLATELAHPDVSYIEVDQLAKTFASVQTGATWGLDRIDQRALPLGKTYSYNSSAGVGATVYILDTGVYAGNVDFGGRAVAGYNAITNEPNTDLNGHGTHCAGTVGGKVYGVSKGTTLVGVKVLAEDGSGSYSGIIAGINWVTQQKKTSTKPMVASMSLGGPISTTVDAAVASSIAAGITYVIAAGNSNQDACNFSPARVPAAITVGATDNTDRRASYSNWGACVDVFAPGTNIDSDWIDGTTAHKIISGTSMACPHVSGVLAMHLAQYPSLTPAQAQAWVKATATKNVVTLPGTGSPNLLLYSPYA